MCDRDRYAHHDSTEYRELLDRARMRLTAATMTTTDDLYTIEKLRQVAHDCAELIGIVSRATGHPIPALHIDLPEDAGRER